MRRSSDLLPSIVSTASPKPACGPRRVHTTQPIASRGNKGPLTWATLRVLRVLLWRFHGADGGGRCFPRYEKIATAAKCCRDTVNVAVKALEDAGLLTWVHRLTRIRRREQDLFGHWGSVWQVIRTSNGYQFLDPLGREPGRRVWCKSENPPRPQNREKRQYEARLDGARVTQGEPPRPPPVPPEPPAIAPNGNTSLLPVHCCQRPSARHSSLASTASPPRAIGLLTGAISKPGSATHDLVSPCYARLTVAPPSESAHSGKRCSEQCQAGGFGDRREGFAG